MKRIPTAGIALAAFALGIGTLAQRRIAAAELDLGSGLLVLLSAGLGCAALAELALALGRASRETRSGVRLAVGTTALLLLGSELFVRFGWGKYESYSERNGSGSYESVGGHATAIWYEGYPPGRSVHWPLKEYVHVRQANSMGLHERELPLAKPPDEYRIVALGDSFTEGMGAGPEATWVAVMERELRARLPGARIQEINAGVSGSDVVFEYVLLRDRLLAYAPDLVVVALHARNPQELVNGRDDFGLGELLAEPSGSLAELDVIDVIAYCRREGVMIGPEAPRFFWPIDGHHNPEGYAVLGRAIADGILALPDAPLTRAGSEVETRAWDEG